MTILWKLSMLECYIVQGINMKYHVISDASGEVIYTNNSLEVARKYAKDYPYDAYVLEDTYEWH